MKQIYRINGHFPPVQGGSRYCISFVKLLVCDDFDDAYRQAREKWPALRIQCINHVGEAG